MEPLKDELIDQTQKNDECQNISTTKNKNLADREF